MTKIPTTTLIQDTDFNSAWARAVRHVVNNGIPLTIGDTEEPKPILDSCVLFELTGHAIEQIENREIHPQFPFKFVDAYCDEFTREYQAEYLKREEVEKFSYLYFDRLTNYTTSRLGYTRFSEDQLDMMDYNLSEQIHNEISSNRNQAITWQVGDDPYSNSPPCLQRVWIRYLGDRDVEIHWDFRSRDGYGAWQANVVALTDMLNREVIKPNGCKIVKIVDYSDSFHIYLSDIDAAKEVKLVSTNPMDQR